jgi:hypothetical protein
MLGVMRRLREVGYERVVEPYAGAFIMPSVHAVAGWPGRSIFTSDVSMYTSVHGYALAGRDVRELGIRLDGNPLELTGDPIVDAAHVLYVQGRVRTEAKPDVPYWKEVVTDLDRRKEEHVNAIRSALEKQGERLAGMTYEVEDMWRHIGRVADDPKTVISCNPPT